MAAYWVYLIVGAALTATAELVLLERQRRMLLSNRWPPPQYRKRKRQWKSGYAVPLGRLRFHGSRLLGVRGKRALKRLILPLAATSQRLFAIISKRLPRDSGSRRNPVGRSLTRVVQHALSKAQNGVDAVLSPKPEASLQTADAGPTDAAPQHVTHEERLTVAASPSAQKLKCHAARSVLHWMSFEEASAPDMIAVAPPPEPAPVTESPTEIDARGEPAADSEGLESSVAEEGVVYVDAAGRFTFANPAARALLHWGAGELALSDVLVGGSQESDALLYAVARQELIGRPVTLSGTRSRERLEMSGLPFRDRDGNLWGAALFLRRVPTFPTAATDTPSAPSRP